MNTELLHLLSRSPETPEEECIHPKCRVKAKYVAFVVEDFDQYPISLCASHIGAFITDRRREHPSEDAWTIFALPESAVNQ